MENTSIYDKLKRPPEWALKPIQHGRLKGKSDISPQWRVQAMTETFGPCGIGWKYNIEKLWTEPGNAGTVFAFAQISLFVKNVDWSEPIPGIGGHQLIIKESSGLHCNDEAYKMAVTDALSVAMKMLGVAADIYTGSWDGSKYTQQDTPPPKTQLKLDPWSAKMKALALKDKDVYMTALGKAGYTSASEVPKEKQEEVYKAIEGEVVA